jgi:hypothetical protein
MTFETPKEWSRLIALGLSPYQMDLRKTLAPKGVSRRSAQIIFKQ